MYVSAQASTFGHDKPHRVTTTDGNSCHRAAESRERKISGGAQEIVPDYQKKEEMRSMKDHV